MNQHDFWNDYANAMQLRIEGNRMIAQRITVMVRRLWRRSVRAFDTLARGLGQRRHLPRA